MAINLEPLITSADLQPVIPGYPFLFYDKVLAQTPDSLEMLKNISVNEWQAQTGAPLPAWVILEIMAQTAGALGRALEPGTPYRHRLMARIRRARFRRPVACGDQLKVKARLLNAYRRSIAFGVRVQSEGACIADAEFYFFRF